MIPIAAILDARRRHCLLFWGREFAARSVGQAALKSCDKLCSADRASAALGPPKRGKILSAMLQKQIREAGCSIEHRAHGHQIIVYTGRMGSTRASSRPVSPAVPTGFSLT
jgi:hypothetical protein